MKKLNIKISFELITQLDKYLEILLENDLKVKNRPYAESCVIATVTAFRIKKLHPHTHWNTHKPISLKLDAPNALALASIIFTSKIPANTQLGNYLLKLSGEIDQHFQ